MKTFTVLPYLVAMIVAIVGMPTNVYRICAWNAGTLAVDAWRQRTNGIARAAARLRSWFARLWSPRLTFACAAVLLALLTSDLSASYEIVALGAIAPLARTNLEAELKEATRKAKEVMTTADKDNNRELTAEERKSVQAHLDEARRVKAQIDRIDGDEEMRKQIEALSAAKSVASPGETARRGEIQPIERPKSIGQLFVESPVYDEIRSGKHQRQNFSASVEMMATTLDESAGSGGDLVLEDIRPGIQPLLFRTIRVTQLLAPGTTESNTVEYLEETTFTNAAAARAEAAAAAESTLVFDRKAETVRSIAHFLPVTNEMLEDVGQIQSYIDGRLRLGVALAEENQLLNGSGTPPNLTGLLNRASLHADQARGTDTNADAIFKQIMALMTDSFLMPDGVVIHPTNWQTIVLTKDGNGQYYGAGPFGAMQTPVIWGLPASVTPLIVANTSLVGAYGQAAQRFVRRGVTVSASNSHSDYFTKRLVAIMAEMREALAVYRPGAFGKVTGLN